MSILPEIIEYFIFEIPKKSSKIKLDRRQRNYMNFCQNHDIYMFDKLNIYKLMKYANKKSMTNNMKIAKQEIFGPVLSIIPFENEEEAITITNDTEYGLGNYLQTENKERAQRVAKKLRSGCVYINGKGADSGTPFGGFRQSGNGREGGKWGLEEYLEVKTITGWK